MTDDALKIVLSFVTQMNEWEHKMYLIQRLESGGVINHASDRALLPNEPAAVFKQRYFEIFDAHCTKRKRTYGGSPISWARHGRYKDASAESVERVEEVRKGRAEVVLRGGTFHGGRFLFVVLRAKDGWRIDSAKWGKPDDWSVHHL
jgi:hypothetical protein